MWSLISKAGRLLPTPRSRNLVLSDTGKKTSRLDFAIFRPRCSVAFCSESPFQWQGWRGNQERERERPGTAVVAPYGERETCPSGHTSPSPLGEAATPWATSPDSGGRGVAGGVSFTRLGSVDRELPVSQRNCLAVRGAACSKEAGPVRGPGRSLQPGTPGTGHSCPFTTPFPPPDSRGIKSWGRRGQACRPPSLRSLGLRASFAALRDLGR